jgi:Tol biopolymer transport system component
VTTTAYPAPPTTGYPAPATPTAAPSALPTTPAPPTETPASEATPTATAEPEVWEIWFSGMSCEGLTFCEFGPGDKLSYYSIKSNGTELLPLDVSSFPPVPEIPAGAPPRIVSIGMVSPPKYSPDGKHLLYFGQDLKLYLLDLADGSWRVLIDTGPEQALAGPYCWSTDGKQILFAKIRGPNFQTPVVFSIDLASGNLTELFVLRGLEGASFGDCSPNGLEIVMQSNNRGEKEKSGLYIVNLQTGDRRQILKNFFVEIPRSVSSP